MTDPLLHLTPEDHQRRALMRQRERVCCSWPRPDATQVPFIQELDNADVEALSRRLSADPGAATTPIAGELPLLRLLGRGPSFRCSPEAVRACARLLLDAGADPNSHWLSGDGRRFSALLAAVESGDPALAALLVERGAFKDRESLEAAFDEFDDYDASPFNDLFS